MTLEERIAKLEAAVFPEKTERKLVSLDEWNRERKEAYKKSHSQEPRRNGIACPNCSKELCDSNPSLMMTSLPPQKAVHCEACDFKGNRIA